MSVYIFECTDVDKAFYHFSQYIYIYIYVCVCVCVFFYGIFKLVKINRNLLLLQAKFSINRVFKSCHREDISRETNTEKK